jgi:myo-inositol-1(or 4)-monophosphatase
MMSVIYQPVNDQLFTALRGQGAKFNYKRLRVQQQRYTDKTLIAFLGRLPVLGLLPAQYDYRNLGSTFLHFCYAASGKVDLVVSTEDKPQSNIEIPRLILEEAGGVMLNLEAGEMFEVAARYVAGPWPYASALHKLVKAKQLI